MKYKINKPSKKVENTAQETNKNRNMRSRKHKKIQIKIKYYCNNVKNEKKRVRKLS
jgi:hypothetical protein